MNVKISFTVLIIIIFIILWKMFSSRRSERNNFFFTNISLMRIWEFVVAMKKSHCQEKKISLVYFYFRNKHLMFFLKDIPFFTVVSFMLKPKIISHVWWGKTRKGKKMSSHNFWGVLVEFSKMKSHLMKIPSVLLYWRFFEQLIFLLFHFHFVIFLIFVFEKEKTFYEIN